MRRSIRPLFLSAVAVVAIGTASCSAASEKASEKAGEAMLDMAKGDWTCRSSDEDVIHLNVADDGTFSADSTDGDGDKEEGEGTWKVVEQNIEVSIGSSIVKVLGGNGLAVDAGSITLEVPSMDRGAKRGDTERQDFSVSIEGTDTVKITPTGKAAERYPSGAITCERGA